MSTVLKEAHTYPHPDNPGILWLINANIHKALGLRGAPIAQGQTPSESEDNFSRYLYRELVAAAPISEETCGIIKVYAAGTPDYYPYGFQCMCADELKDVETRSKMLFNQVNPPAGSVAEWSDNVEAARLQCGVLFILHGGHAGRGELTITPMPFSSFSHFTVDCSRQRRRDELCEALLELCCT